MELCAAPSKIRHNLLAQHNQLNCPLSHNRILPISVKNEITIIGTSDLKLGIT